MPSKTITAPAKINLFLHITGKREDGYHLLQSLVVFANIGDEVTIEESDSFSLTIENNPNLPTDENNLITQAVRKVADVLYREPNVKITVQKNIPVGAGLGGGSADAAAAIKALLSLWDKELSNEKLNRILIELGADIPVCYHGKSSLVEGIGEIINPLPAFPPIPAVLVHPDIFCETAKVFKNYSGNFSDPVSIPDTFDDIIFLQEQRNDLAQAACTIVPEIQNTLDIINSQDGCKLSRISGSGSACFGLFKTREESEDAAKRIQKEKPDWWVRPVLLN